jgi:hypothetical protein
MAHTDVEGTGNEERNAYCTALCSPFCVRNPGPVENDWFGPFGTLVKSNCGVPLLHSQPEYFVCYSHITATLILPLPRPAFPVAAAEGQTR